MFKKDDLKLGLLLGCITPIFGLIIYYFLQFRLFKFKEFLTVLLEQKSLLSGIISVSLIANAIVFTICINKQIDKTARGIFIATCIYALVALVVKWLF